MTGSYPQFMQTSDGRAILGRQPTLTDMLSTVNQGAPSSVGGYGGAPRGLGSPGGAGGGDLALGGGGRGLPLMPGSRPTTVPGQGVPTGATNLGALLKQFISPQSGPGGAGGAGGTAPGGIGPGETAAAQGNRFAQANAAVSPSLRNAMQMAGLVMSPMTAPQQLLGDYLGSMLGFGSGFNVPGPRLTPQQLQQVSMAYQQFGPAYAQRLLASMRNQALQSTVSSVPGLMTAGGYGGANFAAPGFGISRVGSTPLTADQIAAETAVYGGRFGDMGGGGADMGGAGPDTGGGLGGGPGNMGGGQNRSV